MGTVVRAASVIIAAALLAACSASDTTTPADSITTSTSGDPTPTTADIEPPEAVAYAGYVSEQYRDGRNWLCHPDDADENVCDRDLDTTVIAPDGTIEIETHEPADAPEVDCFYVYPTISVDPGANSDLEPTEGQEIRTVRNQAARLNELCEIYAPVYRQVTLTALLGGVERTDAAGAIAYGDVVDAWKHYLANDNGGRGVILVGHSQGAGHLGRLLADEIEPDSAQHELLISAMLLGGTVEVPVGADVGGDYDDVPLCREQTQHGCIVTYATFRSTAPPPDGSFFGRAGEGMQAGCTNPAALGGGEAPLDAYFPTDDERVDYFADGFDAPGITTDFVAMPGLLTGRCVVDGDFSFLEITVHGDPADPRADDISGDLTPEWGLHLVDANVAMGDLVTLAHHQVDAWQADR